MTALNMLAAGTGCTKSLLYANTNASTAIES